MKNNRQVCLEDDEALMNLSFERLDKKYRNVQIITVILTYLTLMSLSLLICLTDFLWMLIVSECSLALMLIVNLAIISKAYEFKGFAFREHDISYRSGIIFSSVTTIPYSRIQQVSVTQNPISRMFGLCSVEVVNGAQSHSAISIPGLTENKANLIKALIMRRITNGED